ncbi:MAG: hypothetical protein ABSC32_20270 [Steroidobacteraceae bacterium]
MPLKLRTGALHLLALCTLCGCAAMGSLNSKTAPPPEPAQPSDAAAITPLLDLMSALPKGDPAQQAELFQSAKQAASVTPTTSNRLKYALALAIPGHGGSDPVAAQRQLSELLARPETLLPDERLLALVELQEVDQRLVLQAENQRLRDEALHDSKDKLQAANHRLQSELDDNARLRKALDEARAKLDAVTHIERSINDRATSEPPHTP